MRTLRAWIAVNTTKKAKDLLQDAKLKLAFHPNITKEEREVIKTLKEDDTWVLLTADKRVAMVIMGKNSHVEKCMTLLQDTNVYQSCRDQTSQIHRQIEAILNRLKENMARNINGCHYITTNYSL